MRPPAGIVAPSSTGSHSSSEAEVITARRAIRADRARVIELADVARASIASQRGGPALLATHLDSSAAHDAAASAWCGLIGEAIVGYSLVARDGERATITELFVEPEARGVGVGDAMLSSIVDHARQSGCGSLDAAALPGDRATKNFFEAHRMTSRLLIVSRPLGPDAGRESDA